MNDQDKISLLYNESKKVKLADLQESLNEIISLQGYFIQNVYNLKPKLREGEVYIETLIMKLIFTSKSIIRLSTPMELEVYNYNEKLEIIDTPSIFILTRSIIETYLTIEYLYFDDITELEKDFRFKLWRVSGYISRQVFAENISGEHIEKLKREEKLIQKIKNEIKSHAFYPTLEKNDLWKLDKYGLPRLKSWGNLLEHSRLKSELFKKIYSLYSNYAHSEYLAMMQLNESNLNKSNSTTISNAETALRITQMINSISILLLKERFDALEKHYQTINGELKIEIELWSGVALK